MRKANIHNGEKVLVNGAGGSIGTFAVQIARAMGAEVTAVDSAMKEDMLRQIGVAHFIDYAREDFTSNDRTYDVIFSMVARTPYAACINALNQGGRYILANPRVSDMLRSVLTGWLTGKKAIFAFAGEKLEELLALKEMIEDGTIKPVVDKIYPFEQAAEAHHRVETEQRLGTVVISSVYEWKG
jgi:NADPH:quinone reductase-like Zn-dependent oxidoreductase